MYDNMTHIYINKLADSKHEMFEDDDECKLESKNVPVYRGQVSLLVSEPLVVTVSLQGYHIYYSVSSL